MLMIWLKNYIILNTIYGVFVAAGTHCVASAADANGKYAILPYYGKLVNIIELNYYGRFMLLFLSVNGLIQLLIEG